MLRKISCTFALIIAVAFGLGLPSNPASAADSDVDVNNGALEIETDESHDLIFISVEGDEVVMHILQYDPDDFDEVPNIFLYSEEELIEMADDYRYEDRDLEDINYMVLSTLEGNDVVFIDESFDRYSYLYLGEGDDFCQVGSGVNYAWGENGEDTIEGKNGSFNVFYGGDMRDILRGGDNSDYLYGENGDDLLQGRGGHDYMRGGDGNDRLDGDYDGFEDDMFGDAGADVFVDRYYEMRPFYFMVPYYTWEAVDLGFTTIYRRVLRYRLDVVYIQSTLETEDLRDFDANEGDSRDPEEID